MNILCRGGSICFYGEWFGRPYDNFHQIKNVKTEKDILYISFAEGESLTIIKPNGIVNSQKAFKVKSALEIIWKYPSHWKTVNKSGMEELRYKYIGNNQCIKQTNYGTESFTPKELLAVQCL